MARKIQSGTGTFIKQTNKKRPGRHSKRPNKRNDRFARIKKRRVLKTLLLKNLRLFRWYRNANNSESGPPTIANDKIIATSKARDSIKEC